MRSPNALQVGVVSALCLGSFALGSTLHLPAMAEQVYQQYLSPDTTCTSSSPCTTTKNNGSGPASANTSVGGTALTGTTKYNGTSKTKFAAGVLGIDSSTKGKFDDGVEGTSVSGNGVQGTSKSGSGVNGVANAGIGVSGTSSNIGVSGNGSSIGVEGLGNGFGVVGIGNSSAPNGVGLLGVANGTGGVGVSAIGSSFGLQAHGNVVIQTAGSSTGNALELDSSGGNLAAGFNSGNLVFSIGNIGDVNAASGTFVSSSGTGVIAQGIGVGLVAEQTAHNGEAIQSFSAPGGDVFDGFSNGALVVHADSAGNLNLAGQVFTSGSCSIGCIAHGPGQKRVVSYAPRESQPTMEDLGEGQLVNGEAHVALDSAFANVIDQRANYFVFMTPDGDCNGLFIAGKTGSGFTVRELRGGHSTLGFEYRIVAKPFGDHSTRLPMIAVRSQPMPNVSHVVPNLKPAKRGVR